MGKNALYKSAEARKVLDLITLKAVKTGIGHDLAGVNCKVYIGKKLLGVYDDDGWGGEPQFHEEFKGAEKELVKLMDEHNFRPMLKDHLNNNEYGIKYDSVSDHEVMVFSIEEKINLDEARKSYTKKEKQCIIFGVPFEDSFGFFKMQVPIADLTKYNNGKDVLLKTLNHAVSKLAEGELILNSNLEGIVEIPAEIKNKMWK